MDPTASLIALDISLVALLVYILDRNVFHAIDLLLGHAPTALRTAWVSQTLRVRLWLDRQAMLHRGPVGKLWNEYCLWRISNNPAYKEFFKDRE